MLRLSRLLAVFLTIALALPLMAARSTEAGAAEHGSATAADDAVGSITTAALKTGPFTATPPASASFSPRIVALSAARLSAARQAVQSLADLSTHAMPSTSILGHLPAFVSMRRRAGERWNTSDSSRPDDFAICYRVSRVMGFQVVPGDLTPPKLPIPKMLSVKNQGSGMGVLVGITLRVGRAGK